MKTHNEIIKNDLYLRNAAKTIYSAYTKKTKLRQLVYETYGNSSIADANQLNIFIDLSSILHSLYSENNRIVIDNITDISAGIINMCAHYRSFFRDNMRVDTRIFLINSLNSCDINRKFVAEYNSEFIMKTQVTQTNKLIENNLKLLKILCPYLPAIYYIDSPENYECSVIMANIIELLSDERVPNLIISHDMYPMQLCAQYKWTSYLYPRKQRLKDGESEDTSWMLPVNDKPGFREEFWNRYAAYRKVSPALCNRISPINYPLLISLVAFPERRLPSLVNRTNSAVKFIETLAGSEDIKIQGNQILNNIELCANYPVAAIEARYKAMDVQYMLPFYKASPEAKNIQFLDLNDVAAVNNIAAKYYSNNPLELQKL